MWVPVLLLTSIIHYSFINTLCYSVGSIEITMSSSRVTSLFTFWHWVHLVCRLSGILFIPVSELKVRFEITLGLEEYNEERGGVRGGMQKMGGWTQWVHSLWHSLPAHWFRQPFLATAVNINSECLLRFVLATIYENWSLCFIILAPVSEQRWKGRGERGHCLLSNAME